MATDEQLMGAFERVEAALGDVSLSYFEFGTLAAFQLLSEQSLDFAVMEIGLGGRLDAVNLLDADCAVITPVGLDHQEYLGDDRESIGREKAGILRPGAGEVRVLGREMSGLSEPEARAFRIQTIGLVFQEFELLDYLDVRDNILLQARLAPGISVTAGLEQQARETAAELGLADKWRRPVTALSQGERQRVAACRALLLDPDLVLADEPTGNLDPANKQAVLDQLISLCRRHQRMLLTVTHDHSLLPAFDRVVDMAQLQQLQTADT